MGKRHPAELSDRQGEGGKDEGSPPAPPHPHPSERQ